MGKEEWRRENPHVYPSFLDMDKEEWQTYEGSWDNHMGLGQPFYIPNMQKSALNIWVWVLPFLIVNMQKSLLNLRRLSAAFLYCQYSEICIHYKKTLKNSEGAIKNG
jgi:hypothetical protein